MSRDAVKVRPTSNQSWFTLQKTRTTQTGLGGLYMTDVNLDLSLTQLLHLSVSHVFKTQEIKNSDQFLGLISSMNEEKTKYLSFEIQFKFQ